MSDKYVSFLNTLRNEDSTLSGIIAPDNNGFKVRWGLNEKYHPGASSMTFEQAIKVYDSDYWTAGLEKLNSQVMANLVFDFGFNHGRKSAVKTFQTWLRLDADGIVGPATIAAANREPFPEGPQSLAMAIENTYRHFGGTYVEAWVERVKRNLQSYGY